MARIEDRSLLFAGAGRNHRRRPWDPQREGGDLLSGEGDRTGAAATLGGAPTRLGTGEMDFSRRRWIALDLERCRRPVGWGRRGFGFLSCQRTCVAIGSSALWRGSGQGMGGEPFA